MTLKVSIIYLLIQYHCNHCVDSDLSSVLDAVESGPGTPEPKENHKAAEIAADVPGKFAILPR
jgi:hypothetical protein